MIEYLDDYFFYDPALMPAEPGCVEVGVFTTGRGAEAIRAKHPNARIKLVEPDRENYIALCDAIQSATKRKTPMEKAFQPYRAALADRDGPVPFFRFDHEQLHSTFPRHLMDGKELRETNTVTGRCLASLLADVRALPCDLLLLNCEGAEIFALDALCRSAELRSQVAQVCTSFHCDHIRLYMPALKEKFIEDLAQWYLIRKGKFEPIPYYLFTRRDGA